ncbi:MAG: putative rane protein [Herbinix sp.]|jgi:hypothetical protein|nr:putative rane protein [Herbinix sp.]
MDTSIEDRMYQQIEKNLSNNINENLLTSSRLLDKDKLPVLQSSVREPIDTRKDNYVSEQDNEVPSFDYISQPTGLTRAEYIRQAREACLRQLSNQSYHSIEAYIPPAKDEEDTSALDKKKTKAMSLFTGGEKPLKTPWDRELTKEENTPQEIASYQSLIIRTVCALVIFAAIFLIDKFDITIGTVTKDVVRQYITGIDHLEQLEEIVVSWFK